MAWPLEMVATLARSWSRFRTTQALNYRFSMNRVLGDLVAGLARAELVAKAEHRDPRIRGTSAAPQIRAQLDKLALTDTKGGPAKTGPNKLSAYGLGQRRWDLVRSAPIFFKKPITKRRSDGKETNVH